ncbi:hypothetical protein ABUW04_28380 [Streptacidiphilus sp. N1-10]|uniref:DNA-binding protein n=1 Tax=Streptacidiphilus jeojiensis TaxID=3229225 RepID=A0ABV6XV98_9ACTN
MSNIFEHIERHVQAVWGSEPVCAHVGDIQECTVKYHPTYPELRDKAQPASYGSTVNQRLWESMVALAREDDQADGEAWRMIVLACLLPRMRNWSRRLSREWHIDVDDVRSAMVEGLLTAWHATQTGLRPTAVRGALLKGAFDNARRLVEIGSKESSKQHVEDFAPARGSDEYAQEGPLRIVDAGKIRDPGTAEKIQGELFGALLQRLGLMDYARQLHAQIRAGDRRCPAPTPDQHRATRIWIDGGNHYYWISDLLPKHVNIEAAAKALGISQAQATKASRDGELRTLWMGRSRVVSVRSLMQALGIADMIIHPDDVENGSANTGAA